MLGYHWRWADTNKMTTERETKSRELVKELGNERIPSGCRLLLLLAEQAEAFLFVLLFVFFAFAGAGLGRQGDSCREGLGAAGRRGALVARRDLGFLGG